MERSEVRKTTPGREPGGPSVHALASAARFDAVGVLGSAYDLDRARGKLRHRDPDEALGLWPGLVDDQWSLVDKPASDGRRFVVSRGNEPEVRHLRAPTRRESLVAAHAAEGRQLEAVAYTLGLPQATVASVLEGALGKLGVSSRAPLASLASVLETDGDAEGKAG